MKKLYLIMTSFFFIASSQDSQASNMVKVNAIGSSPRGQFVVFEEYGYRKGTTVGFSKIRVINAWKNKYVSHPIYIRADLDRKQSLSEIRSKAKKLAIEEFKGFNIEF